jgi:hypothetical protein
LANCSGEFLLEEHADDAVLYRVEGDGAFANELNHVVAESRLDGSGELSLSHLKNLMAK